MPIALKLIVGSTREGRAADHVLPWLQRTIEADDRFDVEVLDLRDWKLPLFQETMATVGDVRDPTYSEPIVKRWNQTVDAGEAFLLLTTEYNHSIPGELKNAVDSVFVTFGLRNKPVGFVGYSGGITGGVRAVEHLMHSMINLEAVPLRNAVLIGGVNQAFDDDGEPVAPMTSIATSVLLDDLDWWGRLMNGARADQLPHGQVRIRMAMAAREG